MSLTATQKSLQKFVSRTRNEKIRNNKAPEEAYNSKHYFKAVFELTGTPMAIIDAQGNLIKANGKFKNIFGYSDTDLEGHTIWNFLDKEADQDSVRSLMKGDIAGGGDSPEGCLIQLIDTSGNTHRTSLGVSRIADTDGYVLSFTNMNTMHEQERIRQEEVFRETQEKYLSIFELAQIGILIAQDGKIQYANAWTIEYFGQQPDHILAAPFTEFIHPDDQEKVLSYHKRRLAGERVPEMYTFRVVCKKQVRWVALNVVLYTWRGKPATLNFLIDIDEHIRIKKAWKESENHYRTIFDALGTPVHVIDKNFRILLVNRAFREWALRSCPDKSVLGKTLPEAIPFLSHSAIHSYLNVFESGRMVLSEERVTIDGVEFFSEIRKIPVFKMGNVEMVITVIRDITSERRIDELKRQALTQIEKNMEQFAILNDHIRNPLQAIVGFADLDGGDLAEKIFIQAKEIDSIIKKLDMGWLESKKISEFIRKHSGISENGE